MSNSTIVILKESHKLPESDEFYVIEINDNGLVYEAFVNMREFARQDFFNNRLKD